MNTDTKEDPNHDESTSLWIRICDRCKDLWALWQWRITYMCVPVAAVAYVLWMTFKTTLPLEIMKWCAGVVAAFVVHAVISTHRRIYEGVESKPFDKQVAGRRIIARIVDNMGWKLTRTKPIDVRIIGVALTHSRTWIEQDLLPLMKKNPWLHIDLRIVFVDEMFLERAGYVHDGVTWAVESRRCIQWIREILIPHSVRHSGRLRLLVRVIPHPHTLHGVLVERDHLFLGRVSFEDGDDRNGIAPANLSCSANGYRYYRRGDAQGGTDRISLFRKWMCNYCYGVNTGQTILNDFDDGPNDFRVVK